MSLRRLSSCAGALLVAPIGLWPGSGANPWNWKSGNTVEWGQPATGVRAASFNESEESRLLAYMPQSYKPLTDEESHPKISIGTE